MDRYALKLARALEDEGFSVVPFHPGLVQTDMTPPEITADLSPDESATKSLAVLKGATNGQFVSYDGSVLPW